MKKRILFFFILLVPCYLFPAFEFLDKRISFDRNLNSSCMNYNPAQLGLLKNIDLSFIYKTPLNDDLDEKISASYLSSGLPMKAYGTFALSAYLLNIPAYSETFYTIGYGNNLKLSKFFLEGICFGAAGGYFKVEPDSNGKSFYSVTPGITVLVNEMIYLNLCYQNAFNTAESYFYQELISGIMLNFSLVSLKMDIKTGEMLRYFFGLEFDLFRNGLLLKLGRDYEGELFTGLNYNLNFVIKSLSFSAVYQYKETLSNIILGTSLGF